MRSIRFYWQCGSSVWAGPLCDGLEHEVELFEETLADGRLYPRERETGQTRSCDGSKHRGDRTPEAVAEIMKLQERQLQKGG